MLPWSHEVACDDTDDSEDILYRVRILRHIIVSTVCIRKQTASLFYRTDVTNFNFGEEEKI